MITKARVDACSQWLAQNLPRGEVGDRLFHSILEQFRTARTNDDLLAVHVRLHAEVGISSSTMHFMNGSRV